uniref:histidine--tRNA ligase n=1 Tax=Antithamnion hubbsii TaxID=1005974 RepID=A0A4D6WK21_9FLOR|nr:Histidine-tRNA ligase [Antithamnion hubbsii]
MQPLRGTKDILPNEVRLWQYVYNKAYEILSLSNYNEIRTPILETTELFQRSIGNGTDIINKEMYSFIDRGNRSITLRPEGTASIARAFIHNKFYLSNTIQRLWYFAPMFRYERPQNGRQRQFHQLGIECIGSHSPIADTEVIRLACQILKSLECNSYTLEINSIGNLEERKHYKNILINYLEKYIEDLDQDSKNRLYNNPLRILDSKNKKTQEIIKEAPYLISCLKSESQKHFSQVCDLLNSLNIKYIINNKLVRGLDYYNYTAFEIKTDLLGGQDTICGGGRYDTLIKQLGGPDTPSVGWAIGIERLLILTERHLKRNIQAPTIYLINQNFETQKQMWQIIEILEKNKISFELDISEKNFQKQIKKAYKSKALVGLIIGENELATKSITLKHLKKNTQKTVPIEIFLQELKQLITTNNISNFS